MERLSLRTVILWLFNTVVSDAVKLQEYLASMVGEYEYGARVE
jgi:hypothetical protein